MRLRFGAGLIRITRPAPGSSTHLMPWQGVTFGRPTDQRNPYGRRANRRKGKRRAARQLARGEQIRSFDRARGKAPWTALDQGRDFPNRFVLSFEDGKVAAIEYHPN